MLVEMHLPKFDIYQSAVAAIVLRATQTLSKIILSDVRSGIHLVRRNIVSTGQSVRA